MFCTAMPRALFEAFLERADSREGWQRLLEFLAPIAITGAWRSRGFSERRRLTKLLAGPGYPAARATVNLEVHHGTFLKGTKMAVREDYPPGQFCWVDLASRDMTEAREFYRRLFGWQCVDRDAQDGPPYAQFELDGKSVAGLAQIDQAGIDAKAPAMWNSYIRVDDIESTCNQVIQLGGKVVTPVTKVRDAGSVAHVQDPTGARVGLWQKDRHFGAVLHQDYHCFCWNELCTRDIEGAAAFYGRLLGWEFAEYPSHLGKYYVVRHAGEECSGLLQMDYRWGEMQPRWFVYFAVQSVDLTVDRVRQLGGYVMVRPFDIQEGRLAIVADSQGALFDLVQMQED